MAKIKGGGTKKVCLPAAKVRSMSQAERDKVVRAKRSAASQGKYKRSSKSFVKGARKKGATLRDWFEKENWINVATGEPCGGGSKKRNRNRGASMKQAPYGPSAAEPRRTIGRGKNFNKANPTGTGAKAGGGMTQKGVDEYKRKNPGSKLKTAVTKKPSELKPGSKDAKRRKSFCARSKSWTSERGKAARRRWNC
jgi:hypothetical protein|tara:strand:- start:287 stop:871 length:585 start_codon:yes stop_codon:yes gene_type:complete